MDFLSRKYLIVLRCIHCKGFQFLILVWQYLFSYHFSQYMLYLAYLLPGNTPQYLGQIKSNLQETLSIQFHWILMFVGLQVHTRPHSAWRHACNLGCYNTHERVCVCLYLIITFEQCIIRRWWRKFKFFRRFQYTYTHIHVKSKKCSKLKVYKIKSVQN